LAELLDTIIDLLEKLDTKLEDAEKSTKVDAAKEKIKELRKKVRKTIEDLKKAKKQPKAVSAFDGLNTLLGALAEQLPEPIDKFVKGYLESFEKALDTAYGLALGRMERTLKDNPDPTDEEIHDAAVGSAPTKSDQEWVEILYRLKHPKKKEEKKAEE